MDSTATAVQKNDIPEVEQPAVLPGRILIRSSNWLGDAVMTVPAVRAIKLTSPGSHVTVLTRSKLADFWKMVPEVDEVISCKQNEGVFAVAKKIRTGFDLAIIFPNSIRSALEVYLAKIPRRTGTQGKHRRWLLTSIFSSRAKQGPPRHQMYHYLDLVEFAGAKIDENMRRIDRALHTTPRPAPVENTIPRVKIGVCPGAEYGPAKRWLPERFAEVINAVSKRRECEWMLFGTVRDARVGGEITGRIDGNFSNLIGKTTLAELITALSECRLLLTNDTGTMHLAAFLGVPTVSIFGSTEPALTGPLGSGNRVLRHHVECSPCFLRDCPLDFRCMKAIGSDEVVEAVLRMLDT
jgi:lipopolysaccharide heptosyltransferase II